MGDLDQANSYFDWWYGPALSDPQAGDMSIVLATIRRGNIGFRAFEAPPEAAAWAVGQTTHNVFTHIALHAAGRPKRINICLGLFCSWRCLTGAMARLGELNHALNDQGVGLPPTPAGRSGARLTTSGYTRQS